MQRFFSLLWCSLSLNAATVADMSGTAFSDRQFSPVPSARLSPGESALIFFGMTAAIAFVCHRADRAAR